jgi:hypothetical protein
MSAPGAWSNFALEPRRFLHAGQVGRAEPAGTSGIARSCFQMITDPQPNASNFEFMLARAFDLAWEEFLTVEGAAEDTAENRGSLAARIVVLGKLTEPDEAAIGTAALVFLRALVAARRLGRSQPPATTESGAPGAMLDPEAIDITAGAIAACLEELPDGISPQARSILSQSILENAGNGERDINRLRSSALEALRSRR